MELACHTESKQPEEPTTEQHPKRQAAASVAADRIKNIVSAELQD